MNDIEDEKISYRLPYIMFACILLGASMEYAYMDKILQQESIGQWAYACDLKLGSGQWQTERINYNIWVCIPKTTPITINESINFTINRSINYSNMVYWGTNGSNKD